MGGEWVESTEKSTPVYIFLQMLTCWHVQHAKDFVWSYPNPDVSQNRCLTESTWEVFFWKIQVMKQKHGRFGVRYSPDRHASCQDGMIHNDTDSRAPGKVTFL